MPKVYTEITFVLMIFLALASFVLPCAVTEPKDMKWVNFTSRIMSVEPKNAAVSHRVAGSVKIITGCSFSIRNMTIIPPGGGVYWWGIPVNNNTEPYPRVVMMGLGSYNGQTVTFTLDPQYSFDDIAIMEIYSEYDNRPYGAWALTGNISQYYGIDSNNANVDINPEDPWSTSSAEPVKASMGRSMLMGFILVFVAMMWT